VFGTYVTVVKYDCSLEIQMYTLHLKKTEKLTALLLTVTVDCYC